MSQTQMHNFLLLQCAMEVCSGTFQEWTLKTPKFAQCRYWPYKISIRNY